MIEIKKKDLRWCPRCGGRLEGEYNLMPICVGEDNPPENPKPTGKVCQRCGWKVKL